MSRHGPLAAGLATLLGATLGGLLIWRTWRARRKRLPQGRSFLSLPQEEKAVDSVEQPGPVEPEAAFVKCLPVVECLPPLAAPLPPLAAPLQPPLPPPPSAEQLLGVKPVMVSSEEEWQQLWPSLQKDLSVFPVLGLDCEWVSVKGKTSAVSLLQLASYSGRCVLVRLLPFCNGQQTLPLSLVALLRDPHVLKVGVGCFEDGKRLSRDHGLALGCTVDLRYLALRQKQVVLNNGLSLKSLAADVLNVSLDKSLGLRCSDWEADQLTLEQMAYAARDAQVSVALFFQLLDLNTGAQPPAEGGSVYAQLSSRCQGLLDVPFRGRAGGEGDDKDRERRRCNRKPTFESPESGDQQVPDPRKIKRKPLGVGYSARKSPLYDNCFLHAPDGQPVGTCDKKKAKWYLDKGIGELVSEEPFVVQLLFEPSGRPDSRQDYYLTAKENLCVVCGKEDSYIRKNIVPHEYRRHLPTEMKDHNSHDILLLCLSCHVASNFHDGSLKQQLADEYLAPQRCEEGVCLLEDSDRRRVRSAARALLTAREGLPEQRRAELQAVIRSFYCGVEELTAEMLQQAACLETRIFNESYIPHGLKVVRAHGMHGAQGLMDLERRWRQHFLTTMRPRHLPPLWSVNHNHDKFLRKYREDLPTKLN